jgi:acetoacetate decarboxylase
MFVFDQAGSYTMPAHFGPRRYEPGSSGWYHDVTAFAVPYLTDREQLAAYLPEPFEVADEPMVTVFYAQNRQVDWLAGHGYNMIGVNASVVYDGPTERLAGTFSLVIWENLADPILSGRELQGIPKIYADIGDVAVDDDGTWSAGAAHFGHPIIELSVSDLREPTPEEIETAQRDHAANDNPMGWRHLPSVGGPGASLSEPTTFPSENVFTEAWIGAGTVDWHHLTWKQNPTQYRIVNALADLPVLEHRPAVVTRGSTNLFLPERLTRVLR